MSPIRIIDNFNSNLTRKGREVEWEQCNMQQQRQWNDCDFNLGKTGNWAFKDVFLLKGGISPSLYALLNCYIFKRLKARKNLIIMSEIERKLFTAFTNVVTYALSFIVVIKLQFSNHSTQWVSWPLEYTTGGWLKIMTTFLSLFFHIGI